MARIDENPAGCGQLCASCGGAVGSGRYCTNCGSPRTDEPSNTTTPAPITAATLWSDRSETLAAQPSWPTESGSAVGYGTANGRGGVTAAPPLTLGPGIGSANDQSLPPSQPSTPQGFSRRRRGRITAITIAAVALSA